jgi:cell division protein YceG involved in septum cleavage
MEQLREKKVKEEKGMTLKDTLKHIKEKNLYKKKAKTTTATKKAKVAPRPWAEGVMKPKVADAKKKDCC